MYIMLKKNVVYRYSHPFTRAHARARAARVSWSAAKSVHVPVGDFVHVEGRRRWRSGSESEYWPLKGSRSGQEVA